MQGIAVRPAQAVDGEAVLTLHKAAILATGDAFYTRAQRESWATGLSADGYARSMRDGEVIEVAVDAANAPIAFCGCRRTGVEGPYVHPDRRRMGIGPHLLNRTEDALAQEGVRSLSVDASLPAVAF